MRLQNYVHRQGLLALLLTQVAVVLLHWDRLPVWLFLLTLVVLVWRIQIYRSEWAFPNKFVRLLLVIFSVAAIAGYYQEWYSLEPMVILLIIAFLLKLLEVHKCRDALILICVGYFVTACAFLFDQGIVTTLSGVAAIWLLTSCLFILQTKRTPFVSRRSIRKVSTLLLQAVPLMLLMLFVFPRIGALWSVPLQSSSAVTGVSDSMAPGDFSQLSRSRQLAFRVTFFGDKIPPPSQRYWRGLVLTQFDGRRWQRQPDSELFAKPIQSQYSKNNNNHVDYQYEVVLEATNKPWVYGVPLAEIQGKKSKRTINNELFLIEPVTQRIKYQVASTTSYRENEIQQDLTQSLLLPRGFNPRALTQARQWRNQSGSDEDYISKVLQFYNQKFFYTLSPPVLGKNTVDDFLFVTQRGFCEHFASSFVVMMRAVGIPARVVTGYQGGEWNSVDRYLIVRQYDAHAWAEVWLSSKGWVRVDPTAAVAPNRIEQGLLDSLALEDQGLVESRPLPSFAWINRLALQWDSMNYSWQRWVLSYDEDAQSELLRKVLGEVTAIRLALLLIVPAMIMLGFFGFMTLRNIPKSPPRNLKIFYMLVNKLKRRGVDYHAQDTVNQLCQKAIGVLPEKSQEIKVIGNSINKFLYDNREGLSNQEYKAIKSKLDAL